MNKILRTILFAALIAVVMAGCSAAPTADPKTEPSTDGKTNGLDQSTQAGLNRDALDSYSATFNIQFSGSTRWNYQIKTRKSPELREINLHIEGVQASQNLGDIRLVTDGTRTWLIGAGTDQECVSFPNQQGMDPTFIYPESLVSLPSLNSVLPLFAEEKIGGASVQHFKGSGITSGPWKDAAIDIWQVKANSMLYQFKMQANGEDPFFGAGSGKLTAEYKASEFGKDAIAPVEGCEISVPMPDSASMFVRLPGMASFEDLSSIEELVTYYQSVLTQQNWAEAEAVAQAEGATILSYRRGADKVEIHIEVNPLGGSKVKLLFMKNE